NDVYREAIDEAKIEPYAPGSLENVDTDSGVKLTFVVPKRPEVNLGTYREIRSPFTVNEVEDDAVTRAMKALQERRAVIETATRPAQLGDIAKVKINATVTHPASEGHEHAHEGEHTHEGEHEHAPEGTAEGEHAHEHEAEGTPHTDPYMDDEIEAL